MGGSPKVTYQSPEIPKDDSFQQYLKYQQDRETAAEARAAKEKADAAAAAESRRSSASNAFGGMRSGVESQLRQGLISYNDATSQLRDYAAKYDLAPPEEDVSRLTNIYTQELLPGRRTTGTKAAYEELLGRQATTEELSKAQERFNQGYYTSVQDLKDSLTKSTEYQDKFNQSYLDNYYDTQFGSSVKDRTEEYTDEKTGETKTRVTKLRRYNFDPALLPTLANSGNLEQRTGVAQPDYAKYFSEDRSVEELQQGLQGVRDTRQFLFSAGLTNLQGEIDKETQKIRNEGTKDVANITSFGNVASNLVSGFWS
jgi:hypothetical protein